MESTRPADESASAEPPTKTAELRAFLLLTVVLAPVAAVVCVGGYGFMVWMSQLLFGPPAG